jgi:putative acetyltransferase
VFIRRALDADAPVIRTVHAAAFARAGVAGDPVEAGVVDELQAAGDLVDALSLVAVNDQAVIGHVAGSVGGVGSPARRVVAIGPLGVEPSWQRRGVGTALMHAVLGAADGLGEPGVVLLGDPAYYCRFGFEPAENVGILPVYDGWRRHLQVRRLSSWDPTLTGVFRFAPAFPTT